MRYPAFVGVAVFVAIVIVSGAAIWFLSSDARREIDKLAIANADSSQWSLAQSEVEFLALETAVLRASMEISPETLREVRRRYNVFYSRIQTLKNSAALSQVNSLPEIASSIQAFQAFLDEHVRAVDGSDDALAAEVPAMAAALEPLHPRVREISLASVRAFAVRSETQRESVAGALSDLGLIAFLLLAVLFAFVAVLIFMMRASQRQAAEITIARSRLQAIVSTSLDAVIVMDTHGRILDYNGAAERIFGYSYEQAMGAAMAELIIPDDLREAHYRGMERYVASGARKVTGSGLHRLQARRNNGELFPVEFSVNSTGTRDGEMLVAFIRDISRRVADERELVEARDRAVAGEKAKADLLAVMSHEMRTPLNGVLGSLKLLEDTKLDDRQRRYVEVMGASGQMLLDHVNNVLDISRIDAGKARPARERFDPIRVVEDVVTSLSSQAEKRGNTLSVKTLFKEARDVVGDQTRLRQILFNLLGNAIKFTKNGKITVEIERPDDGQVHEFRVIDTGIGIAEEDLERVFGDFVTLDTTYRREVEGTGLGLGIVKRLVTLLDGEIGVESEVGEGTVVWFRLPLPDAGAISRPRPEVSGNFSGDEFAASVLVVEDNEINRMVVREMLQSLGCTVFEAADGKRGVEMAGERGFDLILMDISMPRMDGTQAAREIRASSGPNAKTPIAAFTAHALPDDIERFREAGMTEVLTKPAGIDRLVAVLAAATSKGHAGPTPQPSELEDLVGADKAHELKSRAATDVSEGIARLRVMIDAENSPEEIAKLAHKLAGTAGLVGLTGVHAALISIENDCPVLDRFQMSERLGRAESELARVG